MDDVSLQVQLQSASFFQNRWRSEFDESVAARCGQSLRQKHLPNVYRCQGAHPDLTLALCTNLYSTQYSESNQPWWRLPPILPSSYRCCTHYRCCLEKLSPVCIHNHLLLSSFADVVWHIPSSPSSRLAPCFLSLSLSTNPPFNIDIPSGFLDRHGFCCRDDEQNKQKYLFLVQAGRSRGQLGQKQATRPVTRAVWTCKWVCVCVSPVYNFESQ